MTISQIAPDFVMKEMLNRLEQPIAAYEESDDVGVKTQALSSATRWMNHIIDLNGTYPMHVPEAHSLHKRWLEING